MYNRTHLILVSASSLEVQPDKTTSVRTLDITNPDPMLIVDTHYQYTPLFFRFVTGLIDFWSSGYWPIRSFDPSVAAGARWTRYDIANQKGGAGKCAGYSLSRAGWQGCAPNSRTGAAQSR